MFLFVKKHVINWMIPAYAAGEMQFVIISLVPCRFCRAPCPRTRKCARPGRHSFLQTRLLSACVRCLDGSGWTVVQASWFHDLSVFRLASCLKSRPRSSSIYLFPWKHLMLGQVAYLVGVFRPFGIHFKDIFFSVNHLVCRLPKHGVVFFHTPGYLA